MEFPPSLVTNATKKNLLHVPVEGKSYYVDPGNGTYYKPHIEQLADCAPEIKIHLMSQPIGEEMTKFHEALSAVLARAEATPADPEKTPDSGRVYISEDQLTPEMKADLQMQEAAAAEAKASIPPVLRPSAAVTQPAPASIQDETPTEPELPSDEAPDADCEEDGEDKGRLLAYVKRYDL